MCVIVGILLWAGRAYVDAAVMGTAFTYQGRFVSGGSPANGAYDFEFKLFDALTAGNQIGSTVLKGAVDVNDGYFTATLDFDSGAFSGTARWLQIGVRPNGSGTYTTLTPRHELTPNAYALYSDRTNGIDVSGGNVGIGLTNPGTRLTVAGGDISLVDGAITRLTIHHDGLTSLPVSAHSSHVFTTGGGGGAFPFNEYGNVVIRGRHDSSVRGGFAVYTGIATDPRLAILAGGAVGIGTSAPASRLHVNSGTANEAAIFQSTDIATVISLKDDTTTGYGYALVRIGDILDLKTQDVTRVRITADGRVGIGTIAPQVELDVSGNIRCVDLTETSDEQLKTDVQPLGEVLDKLGQVRAVSFRWNEKAQSLGAEAGARRIGVLAQELEQVFPELVATPEPITLDALLATYPEEMLTEEVRQRLQQDVERTHYKAVSYSKLTVVLLEAVKELQAQNRALEQRIQALEGTAR